MARGVLAAMLLLLAACGEAQAPALQSQQGAASDAPSCARARALPLPEGQRARLALAPRRVPAGDRFHVTFPRPQRWTLFVLLEAREPCPSYSLYDTGDLEWNQWSSKGKVAIIRGRTTRRTFTAVVPVPAAAGTYRVCDVNGHPRGVLRVLA